MSHWCKAVIIYVTGGSGSGKSAFAEGLITQSSHSLRHYIATMMVWDSEGERRVARHRDMRAGKGFLTLESPYATPLIAKLGGAVLVEDVTNLLMNQWFGQDRHTAVSLVENWIDTLAEQCQLLVLVGNQITSDGAQYDDEMTAFLSALGSLSCRLAQKSAQIYEVISGIPLPCSPSQIAGGSAMTFITGGKYQGKFPYATQLAQQNSATIIPNLEEWLRAQPSTESAIAQLEETLLKDEPLIILCDEVGSGVVPLEEESRIWRERVGRVSTLLAQRADTVIRMVCGIPVVIKSGN